MELPLDQHVDEIERLVSCLQKGLQEAGVFKGDDAVSASLVFTFRLSNAIVSLSGKSKQENSKRIANAMRKLAEMLEFETLEEVKGKVH